MEARHLKVWMGGDSEDNVPKPTQAEVLYSPANPDNSRKACRNCVMWMKDMTQCVIHDSDVPVPDDAVCGYHVYGEPNVGLSRMNGEPVSPELSGLERVPSGASCDICQFYSPRGAIRGVCSAVRGFEPGEDTSEVQALGCCARWVSRDG